MSKFTEPQMLLEWARDLGRTYSFFDFHVHPFDVLTGDVDYQRNENFEGFFSKGSSIYHGPTVDESMEPEDSRLVTGPCTERAFLLASRFKYAHTGSKVIADQIDAAGLSGALLLPVARVPGRAEEMLEASKKMFLSDSDLYFACAYPVGTPADKLAEFFCTAREHYKICAIKIHPNLAGIDPLTQTGHDLIEATLEAAGALGLPVIVHAGRTSTLKPCDSAEYGILSHLETIDWSLSTAPVIFAHAGCYELTQAEASATLSKLDTLFQKYPNLMADTSNLELFSLRLVLRKVSRDRLLFGSDALYVPIWKAWLRFLGSLREVSHSPDNDLIRIASLNPTKCLGIEFAH